MQSLEVISINFWSVIISLCNLLVLFLVVKHFLFKPVKKVLAARSAEVNARYDAAEEARRSARAQERAWKDRMHGVELESEKRLKAADELARKRSESVIGQAREKADDIVLQAQNEAKLERRKATEGIRREIVDVSTLLTEKMLEREINEEDHRRLIDSFLGEIGDGDE